MNKFILFIAALFSPLALAQAAWIDRMQATCEFAMAGGFCALENASGDYPPETELIHLGRQGTVPLATYLRVRAIKTDAATGTSMCTASAAYCRANANSNECKVAKAMWGAK